MPRADSYFGITPNWVQTWTAKKAEEQLDDFQFKGPGWYFSKGDAILAIPLGVPLQKTNGGRWNIWKQEWHPNQLFEFMVFNTGAASITDSINALANSPTRFDDRTETKRA